MCSIAMQSAKAVKVKLDEKKGVGRPRARRLDAAGRGEVLHAGFHPASLFLRAPAPFLAQSQTSTTSGRRYQQTPNLKKNQKNKKNLTSRLPTQKDKTNNTGLNQLTWFEFLMRWISLA